MLLFALGALVTSVVPIGLVWASLGASGPHGQRGSATLPTWLLATGTAIVAWVWAILLLPVWLVGWVFVLFSFLGVTWQGGPPSNASHPAALWLAVALVASAAWFCAVGVSVLLSGRQGSFRARFWIVCTGLFGLLWSVPLVFLSMDPTGSAIALSNLIFLIPCELGLLGLLFADIGASGLGAPVDSGNGPNQPL